MSILLAWKGKDDDSRLFYSRSDDGRSWSPQQVAEGAGGSSHGPALASVEGIEGVPGNVAMAWKGIGDDAQIWWSSWSEQGWSGQQPAGIGDLGTSDSPTLGTRPKGRVGDSLIMVWKGKPGDARLFVSVFDGQHWGEQQAIADGTIGSSHGPALARVHVFDL